MEVFKKFSSRFSVVLLFFIAFELVNINPMANSLSTGSFINNNIDLLANQTENKEEILQTVNQWDLNGIVRIFAHMTVFGCLSLIVMWSLSVYSISEFHKILFAVVITSIFGLLDEIAQLFIPNRQFRYVDVLKDDIGAFIFSSFLYEPIKKFILKFRPTFITNFNIIKSKIELIFLKNGISETRT